MPYRYIQKLLLYLKQEQFFMRQMSKEIYPHLQETIFELDNNLVSYFWSNRVLFFVNFTIKISCLFISLIYVDNLRYMIFDNIS